MASHPFFLRPTFTRRFVKRLTEGQSLLVTGPDGQGRKRLFKDAVADPQGGVQVILLDMPGSEGAFIQEVSQKAGLVSPADSLEDLIGELKAFSGKVWLLIDKVDNLSECSDQFWATLGRLTIDPRCLLVCGISTDAKLPGGLEALPLEAIKLPPLNPRRLEEEIARRASGLKDKKKMAFAVFAYQDAYDRLELALQQWQAAGSPSFLDEKELESWLTASP